jgi:hypothetical protein
MRLALALLSLPNYRRFDLVPPLMAPRISSYGARFARSDRGRRSEWSGWWAAGAEDAHNRSSRRDTVVLLCGVISSQ